MTAAARSFELFIDDDRYAVPTLVFFDAQNVEAATLIAEEALSQSIHYRGAELCLDGQRVAGLGSFSTRRLPAETRARGALRE